MNNQDNIVKHRNAELSIPLEQLYLQKSPPHSLDAEKSVLGTILLNNNSLSSILAIISPEDFYNTAHRHIFDEIVQIAEHGLPIDCLSLCERLRRKNLLNSIGGASYVSSLMDGVPKSLNVNYYAKLIREKSILRKLILTAAKIISRSYDQYEDVAVILDGAKAAMAELGEQGRAIGMPGEEASLDVAYREYREWKDGQGTGVTLGLPSIDAMTDDYQYGEVVSIFARTTVGKTFLILNVLNHLIKNRSDIGFFSLEMAKGPIFERMLQIHYGLSRHEVHRQRLNGILNIDEFLKRFKNLKLYGRIYSVATIAKIIEQDKLRIVFIDFLQLIKAGTGHSTYEVTSNKIRDLKELAKNQEIIIFLVVQLSRAAAGGWEAVTIDMARESGAIEELSDFIVGIWDPSLRPDATGEESGKIRLKLLKNKRGAIKGIQCYRDIYTGRIIEAENEGGKGRPVGVNMPDFKVEAAGAREPGEDGDIPF